MSFLKSWFAKKKSEDYESLLQSLQLEIDTRQTRLSDIRLRERRTTLLFTLYTFGVWAFYLLLWFRGLLPKFHNLSSPVERGIKGIPAFGGPVLILFLRRIVQLWYTRIGNAEEKHLKSLLTKQRTTIEDIKKKTNYYSTKSLIDRYDDAPSRRVTPDSSPMVQRRVPNGQPVPPGTPTRGPVPNAATTTPGRPGPANLLTPTQSPMPPSRRQWYDRLADAVLGDDESSPSQSHSRYALICQNCFAHNGLVRDSEWETTQYRCPKCNFLNVAPKARKQAASHSHSQPPSLAQPPPSQDHQVPPSQDNTMRSSSSPESDKHEVSPSSMDVDSSMSL